MKDNVEFLKRNPLLTLLPELSESGQGIIYGKSSMIPAGDDVHRVIQLWWYLMHIGLENPSIRKVSSIYSLPYMLQNRIQLKL